MNKKINEIFEVLSVDDEANRISARLYRQQTATVHINQQLS